MCICYRGVVSHAYIGEHSQCMVVCEGEPACILVSGREYCVHGEVEVGEEREGRVTMEGSEQLQEQQQTQQRGVERGWK